jgi:hypothetical protein
MRPGSYDLPAEPYLTDGVLVRNWCTPTGISAPNQNRLSHFDPLLYLMVHSI